MRHPSVHKPRRHFGFRNFYLHGEDEPPEGWATREEWCVDSLGGLSSQRGEAAFTVPLSVTQAAHSLHLWLEGSPLIPVPEVTRLQEILVPAVARILIADPAGRKARTAWRWLASLPGTWTPTWTSQFSIHPSNPAVCSPSLTCEGLGLGSPGAPLSWLCPFLLASCWLWPVISPL